MNCLRFIESFGLTREKCSGANVGIPPNLNFLPGTVIVSPMEKIPGIKHADDVARVGFLDDLTRRRHQLLRLGKAHFLVALHVIIFAVALKLAGADAHKRQPVAVGLVHVRLNFEDERREIWIERVDLAAVGHTRQGRRRHAEEFLEERLHTEIRQRRAEEYRRQLPMAHLVHVEFASRAEQLHIVAQLRMPPLAEDLRDLWIVQRDSQLVRAVLAGHAGEQQQLLPLRSYTPWNSLPEPMGQLQA